MLKHRAMLFVGLAAVAAGFAWGLVHLLQLRFAGGDVYPEYSSLRGDPLGTKIYLESIRELGEVRVRRNFRPAPRMELGRSTTLFVFAVPADELIAPEAEYRELDAFVRDGGRLVITLYPQFGRPRPVTGATNSIGPRRSAEEAEPTVDLRQKWGCGLAYVEIKRQKDFSYAPVQARAIPPAPVPVSIPWHSAMVFTNLSPDWQPIYARGTDAVMVERKLGSGSIVLATDSYFVSNEALQKEREPRLLAWLAGAGSEIVFDESHLGVQEQPGIAALARRYNLHGGVIALLVVAALFVWKNASSFVPAQAGGADSAAVRGRESSAGFVNLLRRAISSQNLLQTCLDEWHKARQLDRRISPRKLEDVSKAVAAHNAATSPDPLHTYNAISQILNDNQRT